MGDGSRYGIEIDYHEEEEPLGTVGAARDDRARSTTPSWS